MDQAVAPTQSTTSDNIATVPNSPEIGAAGHNITAEEDTEDAGLIGRLVPLNGVAKKAFHLLATRRHVHFYEHHCSFIQVDSSTDSQLAGCFVFSLSNLPEFAPLGWRIGRGRRTLRNLGVDILLLVDAKDNDGIAGIHARFAWVKGGGGFFLIADNIRGMSVTLNGEMLSNEQRLIPYRNTIGIGECYFTIQFPTRTTEQDEQFQTELATFYRHVLSDSVPFVVPTPSDHEMMMGDWVVRNAIAKGTFGHVYAVTHTRTGEAAAAKELWRTPRNSRKIDEEVGMAKRLLAIKHKHLATPFKVDHESVHNKVEKARIMSLLDDTWKPNSNDVVDKYTFFSPLSTSTFHSLIASKASEEVRTILFTQVLEGLAFLHSKGIIHRDIKPANLTVKSYDPPLAQIIDFGSAIAKEKILYDWPGTIPYLAPEQRKGEYHGCSVDYWACGLVGLEILGYSISNSQVHEKDFNKIHRWIGGKLTQSIAVTCKAMLKWEADERMTAEDALLGPLVEYREKSTTKKRTLVE